MVVAKKQLQDYQTCSNTDRFVKKKGGIIKLQKIIELVSHYYYLDRKKKGIF